jgi:hypothetical protein
MAYMATFTNSSQLHHRLLYTELLFWSGVADYEDIRQANTDALLNRARKSTCADVHAVCITLTRETQLITTVSSL